MPLATKTNTKLMPNSNIFYASYTYKFGEVNIIDSHDLPFVPKLGLFFILAKINGWKSRARQGKLDGVAPNFSLMGYISPRIVLYKIK